MMRRSDPLRSRSTLVVWPFVVAVSAGAIASAGTVASTIRPIQYATKQDAPVNSWALPTPDGGLIVFDALRTLSDARADVALLKATGRPVRAILVTHPHPDHITGLPIFKQAFPKALIYSTASAEADLRGKGKALVALNVKLWGPDATANIPRADVLVTDGERLTIGGLHLRVSVFSGGESAAAAVYSVPSANLLVSGDIMTPGRVPLMASGQTATWLEEIAHIRKAFPGSVRVLPGHGPETTLEYAASWQAGYLSRFRADIATAVRPGTPAGRCVSTGEAASIAADLRAAYRTSDQVVRGMPPAMLAALNVAGVSAELSGRACPGVKNPLR